MGKKAVTVHSGTFVGLTADKTTDLAILEFDLEGVGRIAVNMRQAELHSLYQHILSEAAGQRLAFDLR
jgi:hypothetical protein